MIFLTLFFCNIMLDKSGDNMNIKNILTKVNKLFLNYIAYNMQSKL